MKKYLAYSSMEYLLNVEDLSLLTKSEHYYKSNKIIILLGNFPNQKDSLLSGLDIIKKCKRQNKQFIMCKIAYYSFNPILAFFIHLIKPIKRKSVLTGYGIYRTKLSWLLQQNITRGLRNKDNAYQLKNKKWYIPEEERLAKYEQLLTSLKNGYNFNFPLLVGLNRYIGIKDQLLQGHHRIGICQELQIEDISISFWAFPQSIDYKHLFKKLN